MGFSKKIKEEFKKRGFSKKEVAAIMGISEVMIGKFMNTDNYSKTFIGLLIEHFPEISIDYLIRDNIEQPDQLNEPAQSYNNSDRAIELLAEVEKKLKEIKKILAQNCHNQ